MSRGFSTPRTATGRSALVQPLPHHIGLDALHVTFRSSETAVANFLPPGLEPVDGGAGWLMIGELSKYSAQDLDQAWRAPDRCNYNECVLGFYARRGTQVGRYSALVWVDRDWSLVMGQIFGWGKKLASVNRTRINPYNPAFREGMPKVGGTVDRNGVRIIRAAVDVGSSPRVIDKLPDFGSTTFLHRYLAGAGPEIATVDQLMELRLADVASSPVTVGKGELEFTGAEDEELDLLGNVEVTGGYLYQRGWTTDAVATPVR
ncbi:MAG: acetoacetate decarboxylase family protein [Lautropia sp.]